jgi:hypothetical protein
LGLNWPVKPPVDGVENVITIKREAMGGTSNTNGGNKVLVGRKRRD